MSVYPTKGNTMSNHRADAPIEAPPVKSHKALKIFLGVTLGLTALFVAIGVAGGSGSDSTATPTATPSATQSVHETQQERLTAAVNDALPDALDRDGPEKVTRVKYYPSEKVLQVTFAIDDVLTESLTEDQARKDIAAILREVAASGVKVKRVTVEGTFPMVDQLGNESEQTVVRAGYNGSVIRSIDYDGFDSDNVYDKGIAAYAGISPAFQ
jgi:hypothetical protein